MGGVGHHGASAKGAALEAGFSDPAYVTRVFARRFGVPPSRWREAAGAAAAADVGADPEAET